MLLCPLGERLSEGVMSEATFDCAPSPGLSPEEERNMRAATGRSSYFLPRKRFRASATARTTLAGAVPPRLLRASTEASTVSTR